MKTFRQYLTESTFKAFHNTNFSFKDFGKWKVAAPTKRAKLYGNGIYFSEIPNTRWGNNAIEVRLHPKRPLLDPKGNIQYEDNPLGKAIEAIGHKMFQPFSMSDANNRAYAIEKYLKDGKYDMLQSMEAGNVIFVVRDAKVIENVSLVEGAKGIGGYEMKLSQEN